MNQLSPIVQLVTPFPAKKEHTVNAIKVLLSPTLSAIFCEGGGARMALRIDLCTLQVRVCSFKKFAVESASPRELLSRQLLILKSLQQWVCNSFFVTVRSDVAYTVAGIDRAHFTLFNLWMNVLPNPTVTPRFSVSSLAVYN